MESRRTLGTSALALTASLLSACGMHTAPQLPVSGTFQRVLTSNTGGVNGAVVIDLGDASSNTEFVSDLRMGADGKIYYAVTPSFNGSWQNSGEIGNFVTSTHTQDFQDVNYAPGFIQETADGSVWVSELNNQSGTPTVDRYAGIDGADTQVTVPFSPMNPSGSGNGIDGGIAVANDGDVWIGSNNSGQVADINPTTNAPAVFNLSAPSGGQIPVPQFMTVATDGHVYVTDQANGGVYRVNASGLQEGKNTFTVLPEKKSGLPFSGNLEGIGEGPDGKLYTGNLGSFTSGWLDRSQINSVLFFSSLPLPQIGVRPFAFASANKLYFLDYHYLGIGMYDPSTSELVVLPLATPVQGGIAIDPKTNTPWVGCIDSNDAGCIENVPLKSVWQVYPSRTITLYTRNGNGQPLPPGLIGIGETGNSGPFTVQSLKSDICNASVIPGFDHNIQVNPVAVGTCAVRITDAHGRSLKVTATVVEGSGAPQMRFRYGSH